MHPQAISKQFVQYYQNLGFEQLQATSLLHPSIPMTFVMSAGLAQVETAIDGPGRQSGQNDYVLVQNCFRHFDVDQIGKSQVHLSLFEMPGAFSFGHTSRPVTIHRMWNFLTRELPIDPARLWASYFAGGYVAGHFFAGDDMTRQAWREAGLPDERIVGLGAEHNFWKQGGGIDGQAVQRKCGPNTELFFDRGSHLACGAGCRPGCRCGRFIEFANSLFIYANIDSGTGELSLMPEPFTETVIGTERVAMILTGAATIFEIETVGPLAEKLRAFYADQIEAGSGTVLESERILIDHLRALVFLAADEAPPPGKGGRRRLMRILIRRVLAQQQVLQVTSTRCLPALIDLVIDLAENSQPGLSTGRERLLAYLGAEMPSFQKTLARGSRQLERLLAGSNGEGLTGPQMVSLVKQFGLPLPWLRMTLARKGVEFKENEYRHAIRRWQRNSSPAGAADR